MEICPKCGMYDVKFHDCEENKKTLAEQSASAPVESQSAGSVEMCRCCECGYEWRKGQDGSHSCIEKLQWQLCELSAAIHYPECWDTMAYPTLLDALMEIGCNAEHEG